MSVPRPEKGKMSGAAGEVGLGRGDERGFAVMKSGCPEFKS